MRLIDGDALYNKMMELEELARRRVLDTDSSLPYATNLNPSFTRYVAQLDERIGLKQLVADAPTIEPMRWISAFDKSPDKDGEYLTVIKDHEGLFVEITEFMKDRWVVMYGNDDDYHEVSNVIAWMPIPAVVYERGAE